MVRFRFHIALALAALLLAATPRVDIVGFDAKSQGSNIKVTWRAAVETDVVAYVVERKTRYDREFQRAHEKPIAAHGPNKPYVFEDKNVYKTAADEVAYRLRVSFTDGSFHVQEPVKTNYTTTAIRRTWGSIKAMFQ